MPGTISKTAQRAWVATSALTVFVVWLVTDVGANAGIGFFYAVPVGLAAWWGGLRPAGLTLLACAGLFLLGVETQPVREPGVTFSIRMAALLAVALLVSLARDRVIALEGSAEELETIRDALTPSTLPRLRGLDAGVAFVPSEYGVSGDFYLLTDGPDNSTVAIVGDVVGHGPDAARLATFIRARFAAFAASTTDPSELLTLANGALCDRPGPGRELVSAVCLRLQPESGSLSWAVAGHPLPLRLPGLEELPAPASTFLLGADPDLRLGNQELPLAAGDGVLLYTDGATEVRAGERQLGRDGLSGLLGPLSGLQAAELVERAEQAILEWADGPIRDDLCLLALRPTPR